MKTSSVLTIILGAALCFAGVKSQSTPAPTATTNRTTIPAALMTPMKTLHADVKQMKTSGGFDNTKILADVQAIVDAAKTTFAKAPQSVQDRISAIQASIQAAKSGTADEKQIKQIIHSTFQLIDSQYPEARKSMRAKNGDNNPSASSQNA